ncbi:MAG: helix-turn-helix domain-containing protein, partial [Bacteroidota bacterium]
MTIERDILSRSKRLFLRYGIRSVTMDDISKEMGISKKTLYQYVDNKADLIR